MQTNELRFVVIAFVVLAGLSGALLLSGAGDTSAKPLAPARLATTPPPIDQPVQQAVITAPSQPEAKPEAVAAVEAVRPVALPQPIDASRQAEAAKALSDVDRQVNGGQGFGGACFNQIRSVMCPIIGKIPVIRDVAGKIAMWGRFSCPMGANNAST